MGAGGDEARGDATFWQALTVGKAWGGGGAFGKDGALGGLLLEGGTSDPMEEKRTRMVGGQTGESDDMIGRSDSPRPAAWIGWRERGWPSPGLGLLVALAPLVLFGLGATASAQGVPADAPPPLPGTAVGAARGAAAPAQAAGVRYRFVERYTTEADPGAEGRVGTYRLAFWESSKSSVEVPQAAPERTETTLLVKTTERPALLGGIDDSTVNALLRRYDSVQFRPDTRKRPSDPEPLTGRLLWLERNRRGFPTVLSLNQLDRPLQEEEFRFAAFQSIFVPDLVDVLPEYPVSVGSTWTVPATGAETLLGAKLVGGELTGKLLRIEAAPEASRSRAILGISGRVQLARTLGAVNAELAFEFGAPSGEEAAGSEALVTARGSIVRLSMSVQETARINRQGGRTANATRTRQVVLERRLAGAGESLELPASPPMATVQNSWIRSVDAEGRFSVDHPQEFLPAPLSPGERGIHLMRDRTNGPDDLVIEVVPGDRGKEDQLVQTLVAGWQSAGVNVSRGPADWLPEADWGGRRVYRVELTLTPSVGGAGAEDPPTAHFQAYLIRFQRDATAYAKAITALPDPAPFQREIEEILRTLSLDPRPVAAP